MPFSRKWESRPRLAAVAAFAAIAALAGCAEIHTRDDFMAKVNGRSMQDVRSTIGKPMTIAEGEAGAVMWIYERRTIDVENRNKRDNRIVVVFGAPAAETEARVNEVRFE